MYDEDKKTSGHGGLNEQFDHSTKPTLKVDVEKYQSYLDGSDLSDAQKEEFLQSLWSIIVSFVELGYGVHPLQEVCGKDAGTLTERAIDAPDGVSCEDTKQEEEPGRTSP